MTRRAPAFTVHVTLSVRTGPYPHQHRQQHAIFSVPAQGAEDAETRVRAYYDAVNAAEPAPGTAEPLRTITGLRVTDRPSNAQPLPPLPSPDDALTTFLVQVNIRYTYQHDASDTETYRETHLVEARNAAQAEAATRHHYAMLGGPVDEEALGGLSATDPLPTSHHWEVLDLRVTTPLNALNVLRTDLDGRPVPPASTS